MLSFYCQRPETLFPLPLSVLRTIFDIMFMAEDAAFAQHTLYWCWNRDFIKNLISMHFKTQNEIFSRCGSKTNGPRRGAWNSCLMACSQDSLEVNCHILSNFLYNSQCSAPFGDFGYGGRFPGHPADFFPPGPGHMGFLGHPGQHGPPLPRYLIMPSERM